METKQTAVDWLIQELIKYDKLLDGRRKHEDATVFKANPSKIYEQAKAIEKEQHKLTWERGSYSLLDHGRGEYFEDYYNKTYANDTTKGLPEENSKRRGWHY